MHPDYPTAVHEAAHTVAALIFDFGLEHVTIEIQEHPDLPGVWTMGGARVDGPLYGVNCDRPSKADLWRTRKMAVLQLAGYEAESRVTSRESAKVGATEEGGDIKTASFLARFLADHCRPHDPKKQFTSAFKKTKMFVSLSHARIHVLAQALVVERRMSHDRVCEVLKFEQMDELRAQVFKALRIPA